MWEHLKLPPDFREWAQYPSCNQGASWGTTAKTNLPGVLLDHFKLHLGFVVYVTSATLKK